MTFFEKPVSLLIILFSTCQENKIRIQKYMSKLAIFEIFFARCR